jgi:hypothetical protein
MLTNVGNTTLVDQGKWQAQQLHFSKKERRTRTAASVTGNQFWDSSDGKNISNGKNFNLKNPRKILKRMN